jgi:hypothetical protein
VYQPAAAALVDDKTSFGGSVTGAQQQQQQQQQGQLGQQQQQQMEGGGDGWHRGLQHTPEHSKQEEKVEGTTAILPKTLESVTVTQKDEQGKQVSVTYNINSYNGNQQQAGAQGGNAANTIGPNAQTQQQAANSGPPPPVVITGVPGYPPTVPLPIHA